MQFAIKVPSLKLRHTHDNTYKLKCTALFNVKKINTYSTKYGHTSSFGHDLSWNETGMTKCLQLDFEKNTGAVGTIKLVKQIILSLRAKKSQKSTCVIGGLSLRD